MELPGEQQMWRWAAGGDCITYYRIVPLSTLFTFVL